MLNRLAAENCHLKGGKEEGGKVGRREGREETKRMLWEVTATR